MKIFLILACLATLAYSASNQGIVGSSGVGDEYYPFAGNGGYDTQNYLLAIKFTPATNTLTGEVTITANADKKLSRFNLDLLGYTVRSITVNGRKATWSRAGGELTVIPDKTLSGNFNVVIKYDGIPLPFNFDDGGLALTDDGAVVGSQPVGARYWFPCNDHPIDRATFTIKLTVPRDVKAISNGELTDLKEGTQYNTWTWEAKEPMITYLVTMAIGDFKINEYRSGGISFLDAIHSSLYEPVAVPVTGSKFAISQNADSSYKRLAHTIKVPANGATLSFSIKRITQPSRDYVFVEAHTVGKDDWTTLKDSNGHNSQSITSTCAKLHEIHPFLTHYQTAGSPCLPKGSTGEWWAASGSSDGWEIWKLNLNAWKNKKVEVSITYASDASQQRSGVFIDDIVVSTGDGSTSFEKNDKLWTVLGAPTGSEPNENDWIIGTVNDIPPPISNNIEYVFSRQSEIIDFLQEIFGPYPFTIGGGIVQVSTELTFALETQTRIIYQTDFFWNRATALSVVVHEYAHQWCGDSAAMKKFKYIWLNEGFATYSEWMWSESENLGTAQEIFDTNYALPEDDPFWTVMIGDPGVASIFDIAIYNRGAMTLHQLRLAVGDDSFFEILHTWAQSNEGDVVTTEEFVALAEEISGEDLADLFNDWLFTTTKPALIGTSQLQSTDFESTSIDKPVGYQTYIEAFNQLNGRQD